MSQVLAHTSHRRQVGFEHVPEDGGVTFKNVKKIDEVKKKKVLTSYFLDRKMELTYLAASSRAAAST